MIGSGSAQQETSAIAHRGEQVAANNHRGLIEQRRQVHRRLRDATRLDFFQLARGLEVERAQFVDAHGRRQLALRGDGSVKQDGHVVADSDRLVEVVSGQNHGGALRRQFAHQIPELCGRSWIETARRLIQQNNGGPLHQGARNAQPLVHAARKFHDQRIGGIAQAGAGKQFVDSLGARSSRNVIERRKEVKILTGGQPREK